MSVHCSMIVVVLCLVSINSFCMQSKEERQKATWIDRMAAYQLASGGQIVPQQLLSRLSPEDQIAARHNNRKMLEMQQKK